MTDAARPIEGSVFAPSGPLTFATVAELARRASSLPAHGAVIVDLEKAGAADSSALALFIEIGRHVRAGGGRLEFRNVPDAIRRIGAIYGLETLFDPHATGNGAQDALHV